ncbi:MAG: response regulator [Spirochaeta sp.]|jgi:CheY-like chemotaxis protein|nr:response regulator [Spirochaeta sp.]
MNILVVDDESLNRLVMKRMITTLGHECSASTTGEEAIAYLRTTPCDVVLMDRNLPGIDGVETTRRIRALPEIEQPKIVSLSAYTEDTDRREAIAAGMDAVLSKPITAEQLQTVLADPRGS